MLVNCKLNFDIFVSQPHIFIEILDDVFVMIFLIDLLFVKSV